MTFPIHQIVWDLKCNYKCGSKCLSHIWKEIAFLEQLVDFKKLMQESFV